jgi:hypothetical protein
VETTGRRVCLSWSRAVTMRCQSQEELGNCSVECYKCRQVSTARVSLPPHHDCCCPSLHHPTTTVTPACRTLDSSRLDPRLRPPVDSPLTFDPTSLRRLSLAPTMATRAQTAQQVVQRVIALGSSLTVDSARDLALDLSGTAVPSPRWDAPGTDPGGGEDEVSHTILYRASKSEQQG